MIQYMKYYTQGFFFAILFPIIIELKEAISNTGELKYWVVLVLLLPVYSYFVFDFSNEFTSNKLFSKANLIKYCFVFLGIISSLICMGLMD